MNWHNLPAIVVESVAICQSVASGDATTLVVALSGSVDIAVAGAHTTQHIV